MIKHYLFGAGRTSILFAAFIFFFSLPGFGQLYYTVEITSGLNEDVIANGVGVPTESTTNDVDGAGYAYMSLDYQQTETSSTPSTGLPVDGVLNYGGISGLTYQLSPFDNPYEGNNSLRLEELGETGLLEFEPLQTAEFIYLAVVSGSGSSSITGTINFTDGSSQEIAPQTVPDWYWGANAIITGIGRISLIDYVAQTDFSNPRIYQITVPIAEENQAKNIASVEIEKNAAAGVVNVFALSYKHIAICNETPEPGLTLASSDSICEGGEDVVFTLEDSYEAYAGITYQWQLQLNTDDGWVDIEGETDAELTYNVSEVVEIRAELTCDVADEPGYSEAASIFINPLPEVSVTPESFAICSDGSAILTASGASTYSWAPTDNLSASTGETVEANPSEVQIYTVTGTGENGCENSATATVTPVSLISVVTETSVESLCEPGDLVTVDVVGAPENLAWSYQWTDTAGNIIQDWAPISNLAFTPEESGNYMYQLNMVANTCSEDTIMAAGMSSVIVGFGAEVNSIDYNCNTMGTFILSHVFGQKSDTLRFFNDFAEDVDPEDEYSQITGNANVQNGRMVLTNSQTSVNGQYTIYNETENFGVADYEVSFLLTADQPINTWGTGGGDGMAYSFGDDLETVGVGSNANGSGSKLRLSFDAADNGVNSSGVYLTYGYDGTTPIPVANENVVAYSDYMGWKITTDTPVNLYITAEGFATLTVGSTVVFNQVQMPEEFVNADKSNWFHRFSAHTGGDALRHAIDNLQITFHTMQFGVTDASSTEAPEEWQGSSIIGGLEPGSYNIWISDLDMACSEMIGTFNIDDTNPVVDLGETINICEGDEAVLDAANEGSAYLWNNSSEEQTLTVTESGSYWVMVTDTVGCSVIEAVTVNVSQPSSFSGISVSYGENSVTFTAEDPVNAQTYFWDFGDGETAETNTATVEHVYPANGEYTVTLTVSAEYGCEEYTSSQQVSITTGIRDLNAAAAGFSVYPNPAVNSLTLANQSNVAVKNIQVFDVSGKLVLEQSGDLSGSQIMDVSSFTAGLYFMRIVSEDSIFSLRFTINK